MSTASEAEAAVLERARQRLGQVLNGKWTITRLIGIGGMAVVYEATHRNLKRGAIKILHPQLSADAGIRARFLKEGYAANLVGHRGAVRVDDDDIAEDGAAYLVMELLEGETIEARWARKNRRLKIDEVLGVADQVLDVLTAAHQQDVLHRDLKPENLFLNRDGVIKVLDFGIARLKQTDSKVSATRTGSIMGTPVFMAPEQARGRWEHVDARTDLWAVGAIMYTLLTGRYVHEAETSNETLVYAATTRAKPVREIAPEVPEAVAAVVDKALAYEKELRYADASEMQNAVRDAYALRNSGATIPLHLPAPEAAPAVSEPRSSERTAPPSSMTLLSNLQTRFATRPLVAGLALLGAGIVGATIFLVTRRATPPAETERAPRTATDTHASSAPRKPEITVGPPAKTGDATENPSANQGAPVVTPSAAPARSATARAAIEPAPGPSRVAPIPVWLAEEKPAEKPPAPQPAASSSKANRAARLGF